MNSESYFQESEAARRMLLWLSFECPGRGNPAGCPLHSVRYLPPDDRRRLLGRMEESELIRLYRLHSDCSLSRTRVTDEIRVSASQLGQGSETQDCHG